MVKEAIGFGNTIDEAKENAIAKLNVSELEDIQIDLIAMPKKKVLGLFGGHPAKVRAYFECPDEKPAKAKKQKTNKNKYFGGKQNDKQKTKQ